MRQTLTKLSYYALWCVTTITMAVALDPVYGPRLAALNAVTLVIYLWVREGMDETAFMLRSFMYCMFIAGMAISILFTRNVNFCIIEGPVFLAYLHLEGGYRNGKNTRRTA